MHFISAEYMFFKISVKSSPKEKKTYSTDVSQVKTKKALKKQINALK